MSKLCAFVKLWMVFPERVFIVQMGTSRIGTGPLILTGAIISQARLTHCSLMHCLCLSATGLHYERLL